MCGRISNASLTGDTKGRQGSLGSEMAIETFPSLTKDHRIQRHGDNYSKGVMRLSRILKAPQFAGGPSPGPSDCEATLNNGPTWPAVRLRPTSPTWVGGPQPTRAREGMWAMRRVTGRWSSSWFRFAERMQLQSASAQTEVVKSLRACDPARVARR